VDELLRFTPTVTSAGFTRIALEDVELAGTLVQKGEAVMVHLDAANRDPHTFPDPDVLDLTRHPNPHLAFGHGPHYCVAAQLAKAELRVALSGLFARFPGLRLAEDPSTVAWRTGRMVRGPEHLHVTW
jgi:cytochrome P450